MGIDAISHQAVDAFWACLFTAVFGALGWIINRGYDRLEKRHKRAEDEFQDLNENTADIRYRVRLAPWRRRPKDSDADPES